MSLNRDLFQYLTAVLGLEGVVIDRKGKEVNASEVFLKSAFQIFKARYSQIMTDLKKQNPSHKFSQSLTNYVSIQVSGDTSYPKSEFVERFSKVKEKPTHGDLFSVFTGWEEHGITINYIIEEAGDKTLIHMIVLNKGQQTFEKTRIEEKVDEFLNNPIQCYTFTYPMSKDLLKTIYDACYGNSLLRSARETFDRLFHSQELLFARDHALSSLMKKKFQKVGNCGVANQNITMHLNLATQEMHETQRSFLQCYEDTLPLYKQMRFLDRQSALFSLLAMKDQMNKEGWLHLIIQIISKFSNKYERGKTTTSYPNIFEIIRSKVDEKTFKEILSKVEKIDAESINKKLLQFDEDILQIKEAVKQDPDNKKKYKAACRQVTELKKLSKKYMHYLQAKNAYVNLIQNKSSEEKSLQTSQPATSAPIAGKSTDLPTSQNQNSFLKKLDPEGPVVIHNPRNDPQFSSTPVKSGTKN